MIYMAVLLSQDDMCFNSNGLTFRRVSERMGTSHGVIGVYDQNDNRIGVINPPLNDYNSFSLEELVRRRDEYNR